MRKSYIREKKILCGEEYLAVGVYPVTDQEHRQRGRKCKESDRGQKARNKAASLRRQMRKTLANFDKNGFWLTGTYQDEYAPECYEDCVRDVKNYKRRAIRAIMRRFGVDKRRIRLKLYACRNGDSGRDHLHGFAQVQGLDAAQRRELREMLEDLWRQRIPGTREYEPMGTMDVDRLDVKKLLGVDGQGTNGVMGYIYGHTRRTCVETDNLILPTQLPDADTKWSRKQLREACQDHAEDKAWWEQRFPGWECMKIQIFDPRGLHDSGQDRAEGWEATEPQAYVILRRCEFAKVRT